MRFSSAAHSPRSINWQRLLQNGRNGLTSAHTTLAAGWAVDDSLFRHVNSLTARQFKIEALRHLTILAIQRHKADGKTALMTRNLRIKLRIKRQLQAQQICIFAVVLIKTIQAGLLTKRR
jgi:hypothetical protein